MNIFKIKSRLSTTFGAGTLIATALFCSGCDHIAGAIMEQAVVHSASEDSETGAPSGDSFAAKFKKVQAECPKKINDYTTLQWVKMKGLNRIEYRYVVSESGRPIVNMNNTIPMEYEYTLMTKNSPLADSVIKLDMSVDHIFKDGDGLQMLSIQVNKRHLKGPMRPRPLFLYPEEMLEAHGIEKPESPAEGTPVEGIAVQETPAAEPTAVAEPNKPAKKSDLVVSPVEEFPTVFEEKDNDVPLKTKWDNTYNPAGVQINPYATK